MVKRIIRPIVTYKKIGFKLTDIDIMIASNASVNNSPLNRLKVLIIPEVFLTVNMKNINLRTKPNDCAIEKNGPRKNTPAITPKNLNK